MQRGKKDARTICSRVLFCVVKLWRPKPYLEFSEPFCADLRIMGYQGKDGREADEKAMQTEKVLASPSLPGDCLWYWTDPSNAVLL